MAASATPHLLLHTLLHHRHTHRLSTTFNFSLLRTKPTFSFSLSHPLSSVNPLFCTLHSSSQTQLDKDEEEQKKKKNEVIMEVKKREVPNLTVKEKKELGSYANSLGDKLKSQQVGKSGVTDNLVLALSETLEANELLKLKIHRSCPGELEDVVMQLEQATGSVVVGQIGRTVILYRPSISKLKEEEKKEQTRRLLAQRRQKTQSTSMKREQFQRRPGRLGSSKPDKVPS